MTVKYDQHYADDPAACGEPFAAFQRFAATAPKGSVLDLGCGQGRDALLFARRGHRVVGLDLSSVGVAQLRATARAEGLEIEARVEDVETWQAPEPFDVVILDRVLHMLPDAPARLAVLRRAMAAVAPGGHLLVAEGPKGMVPVRAEVEAAGWEVVLGNRNRLIAQRSN